MNKILISFFIPFLLTSSIGAQNDLGKSDDLQRIAIKPYFLKSKFDSKDGNLLLSKMNKLLSKEGLSSYYSRYIMWPRVDVLSQEPTATAPVMYVTELDVTFYIGDNVTKTIYNEINYNVKGVDKKSDKSYFKALKKIKSTDSKSIEFIQGAKDRIIEFYNSKCDFILKEAESMAQRKEFDKGIYTATSIPEICKECYFKGQELAVEIFKQKMENECMSFIAKAKTAKASNNYDLAASYLSSILPDVSCYIEAQSLLKEIEDHRCAVALGKAKGAWSSGDANTAGKWLSQVSTDSKCAKDAEALGNNIKAKLKADDDRVWDFKLQAHNDRVETEKERIKAIRDIGVAFGENQQPSETNWISRY
jgi:hypothetical protein